MGLNNYDYGYWLLVSNTSSRITCRESAGQQDVAPFTVYTVSAEIKERLGRACYKQLCVFKRYYNEGILP